jgi:hypothetical protein
MGGAPPRVSRPIPATCDFYYLADHETRSSLLSRSNKHMPVHSQQSYGQDMTKATAVIFWWVTQVCQIQQHIQHQEPVVHLSLVTPPSQHLQEGRAQPAPAQAGWDQERAATRGNLRKGLPLCKGRMVLMVPMPHTPPTHNYHPHPAMLYSILMMTTFPTHPLTFFTSTCTFLMLNTQMVGATDTGKINFFDCGSSGSTQPMVQQFNLNAPQPCTNASSVYHPPHHWSSYPSPPNTFILPFKHAKLSHSH